MSQARSGVTTTFGSLNKMSLGRTAPGKHIEAGTREVPCRQRFKQDWLVNPADMFGYRALGIADEAGESNASKLDGIGNCVSDWRKLFVERDQSGQ